jgi:hypothetical protein
VWKSRISPQCEGMKDTKVSVLRLASISFVQGMTAIYENADNTAYEFILSER